MIILARFWRLVYRQWRVNRLADPAPLPGSKPPWYETRPPAAPSPESARVPGGAAGPGGPP
jgi:hypothetical protein